MHAYLGRTIVLSIGLLCLVSCATPPQTISSYQAYAPLEEDWALPADGSRWELGHHQRVPQGAISEYIPRGEHVTSWSEMVSSQVMFGGNRKAGLSAIASRTRDQLSKGCPSLYWADLKGPGSDIVYEWRHTGCQGFPAQHQISRIAWGKYGVHILSYVKKTDRLSESQRVEWLERIRAAVLVTPAPELLFNAE